MTPTDSRRPENNPADPAATARMGHKREAAVAALVTQRTIAEAATTAGISEATLLRWLKEEPFAAAYRAARRQVVNQATAAVQQARNVRRAEEAAHLAAWQRSRPRGAYTPLHPDVANEGKPAPITGATGPRRLGVL